MRNTNFIVSISYKINFFLNQTNFLNINLQSSWYFINWLGVFSIVKNIENILLNFKAKLFENITYFYEIVLKNKKQNKN